MDKFFRIDNGEFIKFYDGDTVGAVSLEKVEDFIPITFREIVIDSNYYVYTNVLENICIIRHTTDPYRFYIVPYYDDLNVIRIYTYSRVFGLLHSDENEFFTYIGNNRIVITEALAKSFNLQIIEVIRKSAKLFISPDGVYDFESDDKITDSNCTIEPLKMDYDYAICYECNGFNYMEGYKGLNAFIFDLIAILTINEYLSNNDNIDAPAYIDILWTSIGTKVEEFFILEDAGHEYLRLPRINLLMKKTNGVCAVIGEFNIREKQILRICKEVFDDLETTYKKYEAAEWKDNKKIFNRDFNDILSTVNMLLSNLTGFFTYRD